MKEVIIQQINMLKGHIKIYQDRKNQHAVEHAKELIAYYEKMLKNYD